MTDPLGIPDYEDFSAHTQAKQDEGLLVKFYMKPKQNQEKSLEQGRPVFEEVEYVDIKAPGKRDGIIRPATYVDKTRFPRHYEAFVARVEMPETGTPLTEWPQITASLIQELAYYNVKTVEQMIAMTDGNAQKFPGIHALQAKASAWLQQAEDDVNILQLRSELTAANEQISTLTEQVERLLAHAGAEADAEVGGDQEEDDD